MPKWKSGTHSKFVNPEQRILQHTSSSILRTGIPKYSSSRSLPIQSSFAASKVKSFCMEHGEKTKAGAAVINAMKSPNH